MNETLYPLLQFYKDAKVGNIRHRAGNPSPGSISFGNLLPRIGSQLLNAQGETFALFVNIEDNRLHLLPLLVKLGGVLNPLCPGDVRDMNKAVYAFINTDEYAKIRDILDSAFNGGSHGIFLSNNVPRIWFHLLEAQGNPLIGRVYVQNHSINQVTHPDDLRRVSNLSSP